MRIKYDNLIVLINKILKASGLDDFSTHAVSSGLCETSLRGVDSHGVKLLPHYVNSALSGRKNVKPKFNIKNKYSALASLDADNAFGHAAGYKAIELGMKCASEYGISAISVFNSSHPGAMSSMTIKAAREGFICFGFTHADSLMLSHGGKRPYFGTNPLSIAAPRDENEPYCLDMATTMISWNKLLSYRSQKHQLNDNLAADEFGLSTNDPIEAESLFPIGGYKGFGLASMVEILCGVYSGMAFGRDIPSMYKTPIDLKRKLGQFYIILKIDGVIDKRDFLKNMQNLSDEVRNEPGNKKNNILMPNDPEIKNSIDRIKNGIPIEDDLLSEFRTLIKKFNLDSQLIKEL